MAATDGFAINSNGLGYMAPSSEKKHASGVQVQTGTGVKGDDTMEVRFEFGYVNMSIRPFFFCAGTTFSVSMWSQHTDMMGW